MGVVHTRASGLQIGEKRTTFLAVYQYARQLPAGFPNALKQLKSGILCASLALYVSSLP